MSILIGLVFCLPLVGLIGFWAGSCIKAKIQEKLDLCIVKNVDEDGFDKMPEKYSKYRDMCWMLVDKLNANQVELDGGKKILDNCYTFEFRPVMYGV